MTRAESAEAAPSRSIYAFPRNLVLAASAGTGKTHALVGVALHLLLGAARDVRGRLRPPVPAERLVATTFSRKAASEIRTRLSDELRSLADGDVRATYRADLDAVRASAGDFAWSDGEMALRARRAHDELRRASIGTFHGFASSIVRTNALVAGISPDFEIPDDEATNARVGLVIGRVLEARLGDSEVAALVRLVGGPEALVGNLRRLLFRLADEGRTAWEAETVLSDAAEIETQFSHLLECVDGLVTDARLGEPARAVLVAHASGNPRALEDAVGELWAVPRPRQPSDAAQPFFDLRDSVSHGARLRERGQGFVRRWLVRDRIAPQSRALQALLGECEDAVREANLEDSVLGFADVLRTARDLLRDHPSVARETGARFDALLVDEFQDTSAVQRDLLLLLWEKEDAVNRRAPGEVPSPSEIRGEGLLVVGDRKQSIYGWRGADVAVFAGLCVGLAGRQAREALAIPEGVVWEPAEPSADFVPLRQNRRAVPALLDFANAFSRLSLVPAGATTELYEIDYAPEAEDLVSPHDTRNERNESGATPRAHWLKVPVTGSRKTSSILAEAQVMAARISGIVRGGELTVKGAPARWRDIAVLALRNDVLSGAAHALGQLQIPHIVAGMGFFGAREVRDAIAMLACLADPEDSLSRAEVLRGPWVGLSDRTLVGLTDPHAGLVDAGRFRLGERRSLVDPRDRRSVELISQVIIALRPMLARLGPGPLLREAARVLQLEETLLLLPRGEQRVLNVRKLFGMADDATDATELLRRLRVAEEAEQREVEAASFSDDDDAVRLLTVHASKGLAFPIVFLPETGALPAPRAADAITLAPPGVGAPRLVLRIQDDVGVIHDTPSFARARRERLRRDHAERRRLRYVAITRASEELFFVGDRAPSKAATAADASAASVLSTLVANDPQGAVLGVLAPDTVPPDHEADNPEPLPSLPFARIRPRVGSNRALALEALAEASVCMRRHQLRTLAPTEAPAALDLRRALPLAGPWGARVLRERPSVMERQTLYFSPEALPVTLAASVDLVVTWDEASMDVVTRLPSALAPEAELFGNVLLQAARGQGERTVRVGLLGDEGEPRWAPPRDFDWVVSSVAASMEKVSGQPHDSLAPRVAEATCLAIGCEYASACYPPRAVEPAPARQTAFDFFEAEIRLGPQPRRRRRR